MSFRARHSSQGGGSRRDFLTRTAALAVAPLVGSCAANRTSENRVIAQRLVASPATAQILAEDKPSTAVWAYNGSVPGPVLRARQGDRLRIEVENALEEATTIHWHGIRVPNAMDGVPHITQPPIEPGGRFVYEFPLPDAGTYWYHPHHRSHEQSARGLHGVLIVDEPDPVRVDRELLWVLGDWRLTPDARIVSGFGNFMDMSHAGRIGNIVTVNGDMSEPFVVRSGERVRLRLVNVANARIFALEFRGHRPWIVALDGQPVEPHEAQNATVVLGPGMRTDVVIDMHGKPGSTFEVHDGFYRRLAYRLAEITYSSEPPVRTRPPDWPMRLAPNPLAEPDLTVAERREVVFTGGMMGNMRGLPRGSAWAVNGQASACGERAGFEPLMWLNVGRSYVVHFANETAWHHPIHLHGHAFRVITRNGKPTVHREWADSVLLSPRETADIAFVADNPGDWMLHCHVLEHQAGGMMACVRVT